MPKYNHYSGGNLYESQFIIYDLNKVIGIFVVLSVERKAEVGPRATTKKTMIRVLQLMTNGGRGDGKHQDK